VLAVGTIKAVSELTDISEVPTLSTTIDLVMEAASTQETSVNFYQNMQRYSP
jgi:hypothetical protein